MIIHLENDLEPFREFYTCDYHKANPGKSFAGCTCSAAFGWRKKLPLTPESVQQHQVLTLTQKVEDLELQVADLQRRLTLLEANALTMTLIGHQPPRQWEPPTIQPLTQPFAAPCWEPPTVTLQTPPTVYSTLGVPSSLVDDKEGNYSSLSASLQQFTDGRQGAD